MLDYNQFEIIFTALALRKVLKLLKSDRIDLYEEIDDGLITISIFRSICKFSKKTSNAHCLFLQMLQTLPRTLLLNEVVQFC